MLPLTAQFCVGCGQVLDDLQSSDCRPCWITAEAYREKYGCRFTDLHLIGDACPPCARVFAIGRRESLPETAGAKRSTQPVLFLSEPNSEC
jgi:hypothetical protein